jgi:L-threonylcarbamoyladenylate synthase
VEASKLLKAGKLVSFPTETVYGLGASAFDGEACTSIFTTKGRPLTDPLIVHVHSLEQALSLQD